jgi:hypothetical protein
MKNRTAIPAPLLVVLLATASIAFCIAIIQPMYTASMPTTPVRNMVRRLYRGDMRAMRVPLMKFQPAWEVVS